MVFLEYLNRETGEQEAEKSKAKEIYGLLIQTYDRTGPINLLNLKRRLWDLKYKSFSNWADFFKEHEDGIIELLIQTYEKRNFLIH